MEATYHFSFLDSNGNEVIPDPAETRIFTRTLGWGCPQFVVRDRLPNDVFTICCKFSYIKATGPKDQTGGVGQCPKLLGELVASNPVLPTKNLGTLIFERGKLLTDFTILAKGSRDSTGSAHDGTCSKESGI